MVPRMKTLYFVRHGLSEHNKAKKWSGSSDSPLAEEGHEQAKEAGQTLKELGFNFDVIISSPLERAHVTAKHIANELDIPHSEIILTEKIVERSFGIMDGKKDFLAATKYIVDESAIDNYDGVEKLADLQKRADEFLQYLHSLPHDTILVVGHGAFARALKRSTNEDPLTVRGKGIKNAEIVRLI